MVVAGGSCWIIRTRGVKIPASFFIVTWLGLAATLARAQTEELKWELGPTGTAASLRGLSAVSNRIVWASGSTATVLRSTDGGSSWVECGPTGFPDLEFRSIHAWDAQQACIASAGTPAVILRTRDGGRNWRVVYKCDSETAFLDGLKFWDQQRGIAFGDPVDGKLLIVETRDGGRSWFSISDQNLPGARENEAGFAASNSALAVGIDGRVWIGTGGTQDVHSRIYFRSGWEAGWQAKSCPLPSGPTQGIFSVCTDPAGEKVVVVGGDYRPNVESVRTAVWSGDSGASWTVAKRPPAAYRSSVVYSRGVLEPMFIAAGPTGTEYSPDGFDWIPFSKNGFHVLAATSGAVFAAGADGRFAILRRTPKK